ncbi:MAG: hypothetical protein A2W01_09890 [Candidatus Solincola sediminis]|uniref:Uncharacterized protein n=1 Tax=Candidatus Solincola sediminis TaxID=1797199 RepID=A0A1F2WQ89_9ACTN|nr:MAG: hypothetical protein A2Y75_00550 [Candidatus Solincola sediminis]OFW61480.1 MAG: hypothetical protein A2W01_09890 [Candidatus Solincola sediminis]
MAESKEKVKPKTARKSKEETHLSDQLEQKFIGARTEVFSRITSKEAEIRSKTSAERAKADRLIEDAKGQAAATKRKATLEEIGKDVHAKIVAEAHEEVTEIEASTAKEVAAVQKTGERNLEKAVDFICESVITTGYSDA